MSTEPDTTAPCACIVPADMSRPKATRKNVLFMPASMGKVSSEDDCPIA
jgi:hypothetical protein